MSHPRFSGPQHVPPRLEVLDLHSNVWPGSHHAGIEALAKTLGFEVRHIPMGRCCRGGTSRTRRSAGFSRSSIGPRTRPCPRPRSRTIGSLDERSSMVGSEQRRCVHFAGVQIGLLVRERYRESYIRLGVRRSHRGRGQESP